MAMSDEAMFAPPQGITIEAVNGMLAERLAQKHGKASLLRAFIPLPPPFSPVQLIELHVLKSNFYYRYHDDGSDVTATVEYQGEMVDYSRHAVLLGSSGMAELRFIRTHGSRFTPQDCTLFNWLARIITPVLQSWLNDEEQQVALRLLEKDRDHHRVLVDITNAVLSHLDLDDLFLWQRDPLLLLLASNGCESALLIPLTFGNHTPGALLLAHTSSTLFSEENCQLLQHIADRIAIAVGNADAWRSMTDLQESLQQENHQLSEQLLSNLGVGDIIYQSQAMEDLLQQVDIVAKSDSTVLICGETGTGKEVIARAIHQLSPRRDKPLVKINCAAIPASLLESELFGHDKGAFTGAINTHRGRFEIADGGTLFLDEIGDLPLELQPKLLRVLQEREIERLGGSRTIPVNVRVIAATNRDLWQMVEDRQFRSDLFYRLNVFPLELPPLRDRPEDIPLLAKHFTQKMARHMNRSIDAIPTEALRQLMSWDWPGNVRELENVIERAVLLTRGNSLNLHLNVRQSRLLPTLNEDSALRSSMAQLLHPTTPENDEEERQRIVQVLRETNGIVAGPRGAATRLGMKRTTLLSRMQRLGISVREVL
ncbi:hydrogenase [Escherichia coli]|uniref:sigma-54-dependent Fis family transcriptional regulator n=1 Tax=Escherichia coli TaxID=562 RepID=UPI0007ACEFEC|nr:sigma-54-dependent Fis family transcriptional regulator [Escherichia coli]KZI35623.1 hydrogenase [Escherichia coli]